MGMNVCVSITSIFLPNIVEIALNASGKKPTLKFLFWKWILSPCDLDTFKYVKAPAGLGVHAHAKYQRNWFKTVRVIQGNVWGAVLYSERCICSIWGTPLFRVPQTTIIIYTIECSSNRTRKGNSISPSINSSLIPLGKQLRLVIGMRSSTGRYEVHLSDMGYTWRFPLFRVPQTTIKTCAIESSSYRTRKGNSI